MDNESKIEAAAARIRPGDRLVKSAELRHRLGGISRMTEWRRHQTDPDFPKPIDGKYIDREIDQYLAVLAARSATPT